MITGNWNMKHIFDKWSEHIVIVRRRVEPFLYIFAFINRIWHERYTHKLHKKKKKEKIAWWFCEKKKIPRFEDDYNDDGDRYFYLFMGLI